MTPRKLLETSVPKPRKARTPKKPQYSSIVDRRTHSEKIAASQRLRSTIPPKKKNAKRAKSEFARCFHSVERVLFVQGLPCAVRHSGGCLGKIDNAHRKGDGASRRASYREILPLCMNHHTAGNDSLHALQPLAFELRHNVALASACAKTEQIWQQHSGQPADVETLENSHAGGR